MSAAGRRALDIGAVGYGSVKSILASGLDRAGDDEARTASLPADHAHIGGPDYYAAARNGTSPNRKES
ncbi:hypothetical protein [Candidatus Palauibacter sp.]|uniref:hypothetical protein n=1 Tax=Candidatus Palauibacter sp. TaxID=3101350 RepID=UPI003AF2B14A